MRAWLLLLAAVVCPAQVIEFESGGLRYQTLTKNGLTIMFAHLHARVRDYATLQVAVSNGSGQPVIIRPDDFVWELPDGKTMRPVPARKVVAEMLDKGGRGEVVGLVSAYETGIYGMTALRTTSGYEARRKAALAEVNSTKLKAAAAASAIAFVQMKLTPGESTDGAMFYETGGKPLPAGVLHVRAAGQMFDFQPSDPTVPPSK